MKKIVLTLIAMVSFGTMMAQDNKDAERRAPRMMTPEEMTERMTKELDMDKAQQAKVLDLNKEYKDVLGHPGMRRGQRGPRPEGMTQQSHLVENIGKEFVVEPFFTLMYDDVFCLSSHRETYSTLILNNTFTF